MYASTNALKKLTITTIRVAIGWHFLYEGLSKIFIDDWTSKSYLDNAYGFLSGFYHWLSGSESMLNVVDFLNVYGLILIGLALFLGVFVRAASSAGAVLLILYYIILNEKYYHKNSGFFTTVSHGDLYPDILYPELEPIQGP